jgi:hypothetical protein
VIPAGLAGIGGAPVDAVVLPWFFAFVALGYSLREALFFDLLKARIVSGKILLELLEGVAKFGRNCLADIHGKNSLPCVRLVVKG